MASYLKNKKNHISCPKDILALISPRRGVQFIEGDFEVNVAEIHHVIKKQLCL
ncbi:MAG: hypothetical protein ACFFCI_14465 [Promethearchaeota archaeon]